MMTQIYDDSCFRGGEWLLYFRFGSPESDLELRICVQLGWASLVAQLVKKPPAMPETLVRFLNQEDPLKKG